MLKPFRRLSLQLISIYQIVHPLVSDIVTASEDYGLQMNAHSYSNHHSIIHFFTWVEGHIKVGKLFSRVHKQFGEVLTLEVRQTRKT